MLCFPLFVYVFICLFFLFFVGPLFSLFLISVLWIHLRHLQSLLWLRFFVQCHFWYNTKSSNILQYRYMQTPLVFHFIWKVYSESTLHTILYLCILLLKYALRFEVLFCLIFIWINVCHIPFWGQCVLCRSIHLFDELTGCCWIRYFWLSLSFPLNRCVLLLYLLIIIVFMSWRVLWVGAFLLSICIIGSVKQTCRSNLITLKDTWQRIILTDFIWFIYLFITLCIFSWMTSNIISI